jgi:hypothetical protein
MEDHGEARPRARLGLLGRTVIAIFGIGAILAGLAGWSLENEYGTSGPARWLETAGGTAVVFEGEGATDGDPEGTQVFEGTVEQAEAYIAEHDAADARRNYTVPVLLIAAGGALVIWAVLPRRHALGAGTTKG